MTALFWLLVLYGVLATLIAIVGSPSYDAVDAELRRHHDKEA